MAAGALERLRSAMKPPASLGSLLDWGEAPRRIGFQFPSDYRAFVDAYGGGSIAGELAVITPWVRGEQLGGGDNFSRMLAYTTAEIGVEISRMRARHPRYFPYPIYPEAGGLLIWAINPDGDVCFWLTGSQDSDQWPIVVWNRGKMGPEAWMKYDRGMVSLVEDLVSGKDGSLDHLLGYASLARNVWVPDC